MKFGNLKEFVVDPGNGTTRQSWRTQGNTLSPSLGVIEVIHAASMGTSVSQRKGVLSVVLVESAEGDNRPKKKLKLA